MLASLHYPRIENPLGISVSMGQAKPYDQDNYLMPVRIAVPIGKLGLVPSGDRYEGNFSSTSCVLDASDKQSDLAVQRQKVEVPTAGLPEGAEQGLLLRRLADLRAGRPEALRRAPRRRHQRDLLRPEELLRLGASAGEESRVEEHPVEASERLRPVGWSIIAAVNAIFVPSAHALGPEGESRGGRG